jgi:hypothetical protein
MQFIKLRTRNKNNLMKKHQNTTLSLEDLTSHQQ